MNSNSITEMVMAEAPVKGDERSENCPKHGAFTSKFDSFFYYHHEGWSPCRLCESEELQERRKEAEQERHKEFIAGRVEAACIPMRFGEKTLDNFVAEDDERRVLLEQARSYVAEFPNNLEKGRCLIFCGTIGSGKTHLACAILHALALEGYRVRYKTVREMIRTLRDTWRRDAKVSERDALDYLHNLDLLVLDEAGVQFGTDAEKVQLFDVIDGRYGAQLPTIIISNLDMKGLQAHLGERVVDRLRENDGRMLVFKSKTWRAK